MLKWVCSGCYSESHLSTSSVFLLQSGCDVNSQSYSGNTALHSACGRGQVDTVRLLLKSGADSSLKNYHNDTPVMVAKNKKVSKEMTEKEWIIKWTLLKVHLAIMFVSCCFKTAPIVNKRNKVTVNDFLVIIQTFTDCNFMMENHIHLLLELRQNKCKQLQILFDSALVRIAGINGWSHKWKLNVYSSL